MLVPEKLKIKYLNHRLEDVKRLRFELEMGDYAFAMKIGHQIKGNAVTFGIPQMAGVGVELEKAAQKKDPVKLKIILQKMESLLLSAQTKLA
jgi:HPt (histidine-containing phosphotransfer) domain-containing protein